MAERVRLSRERENWSLSATHSRLAAAHTYSSADDVLDDALLRIESFAKHMDE